MKKAKRKPVSHRSKLQIHNADEAGPSGCSASHSQKLSSKQANKGSCDVRSDLDIVSGFAFYSFASLPELEAHLASNELKPTTLSLSVGQKRKLTTETSSESVSSGNISSSISKKTKKAQQKQPPYEFSKPNPCKKSKYSGARAATESELVNLEKNYVSSTMENFGEAFSKEVAVGKDKKNNGEENSGNSCVATVTKNINEGGKDATSQGTIREHSCPPDENVSSREKKKKRRIHTSGCQTRFRIKKKPKKTEKVLETSKKVEERGYKSQDGQNSNFDEEILLCSENLTGIDTADSDLKEDVEDPLKVKKVKSEVKQKEAKKARPRKRPKIEKIEWCARSGGFDSLRKYRLLNKKDEPAVTSGQQCKTHSQLNTFTQDEELLSEGNSCSFDILSSAGKRSRGKTINMSNKTSQDNSEGEMEDLTFLDKTDLDSSIADESIEDFSGSDIEFLENKASQDKDRMLGNTSLTITKASDGEEEVDVSTVTGSDKPVSFLVVNCGSHSTVDGPIGHFSRHPEATVEGTVDVSIQVYASEIEVFMKYATKQTGQIVKIVSPDSTDISGIAQIPKYLRDPDKIKSVRSFTERKRRHAIGHLFNGIKSEVFGDDEDAEMYISKQAILDKAILTILTLQRNGLDLCKKKFLLRKKNEKLVNGVKELKADKCLEEGSKDEELVSAVSKISLEEIAKEIKSLEEQLERKTEFWTQFKETKLLYDVDARLAAKQYKSDEVFNAMSTLPKTKLGRNSRASDELKMALGIKLATQPSKSFTKQTIVKESKMAGNTVTTDPLVKKSIVQPVAKPMKKTPAKEQEQIICNLSRSGEGPANFRFVTNVYNVKEMESKSVMRIKITNDVLNKLQREAGNQAVGKHLDQVELFPAVKDPERNKVENENQTLNDPRSDPDINSKGFKQPIVDVNLEKSTVASSLKNIRKGEACSEVQPALVKATTSCSTQVATDSKCQKKVELETLTKLNDRSCSDLEMDVVSENWDSRKKENQKLQSKSNIVTKISSSCQFSSEAVMRFTTKTLKEPSCSSVSVYQTPKVMVLNQNNPKFPTGIASHLPKPSNTDSSPVQTTKDTTLKKISSVALNSGQLVKSKEEDRLITTSSSNISSVKASTTPLITETVVNTLSTRATQPHVKDYSASQTPCKVVHHKLTLTSTARQQPVFGSESDSVKNAVGTQGTSVLGQSVSQYSQRLLGQFVNNPVIRKPVPASRLENPEVSNLKKAILQSTNNPRPVSAVQLQGLKTNALNSPIAVKKVVPTNIQVARVAHPLQGTRQTNVTLQAQLQRHVVGLMNNNQSLSSPPKAQQLNPVQECGSGSGVSPSSVQVNEAIVNSANQATPFSSLPISQVSSWATTCSAKTSPQANHGALNSLPMQPTFVVSRPSCMQVSSDSSACSTHVNQLSSGHLPSIPSQPTYYNVSRGTVLSSAEVTQQGNAPVNIARHFTPINLPMAQKNQTNPLVALMQYSATRQLVQRRESVPAKTQLQDIFPAVSDVSCKTQSSVHGDVIDDLSDIQSIIGSLPTPVCTGHAVLSMSSEFHPQIASSPVSNMTASAQNSSSCDFRAFVTNTMVASSNVGAVSVAASPFPVQDTFSAVSSVLTGQEVEKNYGNFLSNSKPKQDDSNQACSSFLELSTPIQEFLDINYPRNTVQSTEEKCSATNFDIDHVVDELLKDIGQKSVP